MTSGASFIGYYVSLACDNNSTYEGEVGDIDASRQLITLTHAHQLFPDGNTQKFPQITLTGNHINNLKIIRERIQLPSLENLVNLKENGVQNRHSPVVESKTSLAGNQRNRSPKYYEKTGSSPTKRKTNGCFSAEADLMSMHPDFNFEENLAKFDKQAVFEEMLQRSHESRPGGIPDYDRKMRNQENVLESEPVCLRQIQVPVEHAGKEYSTEDGYMIPSITFALKSKLFEAAEKSGLSVQQMAENAGICVCQMALQLLGGSLRINPKNNHQRPDIVVLAGSHMQGLQAVCASRHLSNHMARVLLYAPKNSTLLYKQIELFRKSGGFLINSCKDLPIQPVDMIIDAMIGFENQQAPEWATYAVSWANKNKAPLLSIDPCLPIGKIENPDIKWSITMGLPLIKSPKVGRLYLADLGIPAGIFNDVGIEYKSPFKDKFFIPIYE